MSIVKVDNVGIYSDRGVPSFSAINDTRMGTIEKNASISLKRAVSINQH
jgi:hypothetical protein